MARHERLEGLVITYSPVCGSYASSGSPRSFTACVGRALTMLSAKYMPFTQFSVCLCPLDQYWHRVVAQRQSTGGGHQNKSQPMYSMTLFVPNLCNRWQRKRETKFFIASENLNCAHLLGTNYECNDGEADCAARDLHEWHVPLLPVPDVPDSDKLSQLGSESRWHRSSPMAPMPLMYHLRDDREWTELMVMEDRLLIEWCLCAVRPLANQTHSERMTRVLNQIWKFILLLRLLPYLRQNFNIKLMFGPKFHLHWVLATIE